MAGRVDVLFSLLLLFFSLTTVCPYTVLLLKILRRHDVTVLHGLFNASNAKDAFCVYAYYLCVVAAINRILEVTLTA